MKSARQFSDKLLAVAIASTLAGATYASPLDNASFHTNIQPSLMMRSLDIPKLDLRAVGSPPPPALGVQTPQLRASPCRTRTVTLQICDHVISNNQARPPCTTARIPDDDC